jgi:hypothetical protein
MRIGQTDSDNGGCLPLTACSTRAGILISASYCIDRCGPLMLPQLLAGVPDANLAAFQACSRTQLTPNGSAAVNATFGIKSW